MIWRLFAAALTGVLVSACSVLEELGRAPSSDSGAVLAHGIPGDARAEILWDEWGVPHVVAREDASLFYAVGWAQMRSHSNLMLRLYGQARGRAAEYWGEKFAPSDIQVLQMRVPHRAQDWVRAQDPEFLSLLGSYVSGVNDYAAKHPELIADDVKVVLPITVSDLFAHQQRAGVLPFAFELVAGTAKEWQTKGSNAWAVAPKKSESGNAMLIINPHIPWGEFGFGGLFQASEVQAAAPGVNFYGAIQIGVPLIGGGFNDHLGWGGTVNTLDSIDVYELTLRKGGYLWNGGVKPFDEEMATYKVRKDDGSVVERTVPVKWSIHGAVIAEKRGKALAVRLADYEQSKQFQQQWDMVRSTSFASFNAALMRLQLPKSNVIYADQGGNIFYLATGKIPKRTMGDAKFWSGVVAGDSDKTLWVDTLNYEDLPHLLNPESGWLQNANDPPWSVTQPGISPEQFPLTFSDRDMSLRAQRSTKMISGDDKISFDELATYKLSTHLELADRILDDLERAVEDHGDMRAHEAMDVLKAWDREANADSRGAVLFMAWLQKMGLGQPGFSKDFFEKKWDVAEPLATPDGLKSPAKAAKALSQAAKAVKTAYGALDVPYGDVYRLKWAGGIDLPGNGASGSVGAFRVTNFVPDKDGSHFSALGGDSLVLLIEFGQQVKARALLTYGNSSQPGAKHNGDQMRLYSKKELRPVWRTREEIEAHLESREVLP